MWIAVALHADEAKLTQVLDGKQRARGSRPVLNATINSVPPAMRVCWPGSVTQQRQHSVERGRGATRSKLSRVRAHRLRPSAAGFLHSLKNPHVAGAAAQIAGQAFLDLRQCRMRVAGEQMLRGKNHARRADAALRAALCRKHC